MVSVKATEQAQSGLRTGGRSTTKQSRRTLKGSPVSCVAISPNGKILAAGSGGSIASEAAPSTDFTIKLWDLDSGKILRTLAGHADSVDSVAFSPDGKLLASGSDDHTVKLWDVASGQNTRTLSEHTEWVKSVAFSPDGQTLASGAWDHSVKLWQVATGKLVRTMVGQPRLSWVGYLVESVAFSPDGRTLACGSEDRTIKMWDVASGKELRTMVHGSTKGDREEAVYSVAFSPDGKRLASGSQYGTLDLWDTTSGSLLKELEGDGQLDSVAFSHDGKTLAAGSYSSTVTGWDATSYQKRFTLTGHSHYVTSVAFCPDDKTLASGSLDGTVKLWDVAAGKQRVTISNADHSRTSTNVKRVTLAPGSNSAAPINCLAFSPDGKVVASGEGGAPLRGFGEIPGNAIKLWDIRSRKQLRVLEPQQSKFTCLAFSRAGEEIAGGCDDGSVRIWEVNSGKQLQCVRSAPKKPTGLCNNANVKFVAFSPDGKKLTIGDESGVALFDISSGTLQKKLVDGSSFIHGLSPDGKTVAAGNFLWSVENGQSIGGLNESDLSSADFSADSSLFAAGTLRGTVHLYDAKSVKLLHTLYAGSDLVYAVAICPDGKTLACGGMGGTIFVCDTHSGNNLPTLGSERSDLLSLAYSSDGTMLASGSRGGVIQLWKFGGAH